MEKRVQILLEQGLNARDTSGKTPLMLAAWTGDLKAVTELLAAGADTAAEDCNGENVLHYAARQSDPSVLKAVIDAGIDLDKKASAGYEQAALHTPAEVGRIPILRVLLECGANPDVADRYKMTALHWAAQQGKPQSVATLLEFGANVNTKNHKGMTPLMSAVISGVSESVTMLAEAGAEVNAAEKKGYTPLMWAAYYNRAEIAEFLLQQGADKSLEEKKGETALSIAVKKKSADVLAILQ